MLARKLGAELIVAHVSEPFVPFVGDSLVFDIEAVNQEIHAHARRELERFCAGHFEPDVKVELLSAVGTPHVEIVKLANERGVDLIVMAPHGRGFISHAFLGSTTERVLRRAPCPVLVVRDRHSG
jgi:nucleotide-binding universal stress UspA family protein